MKKTAFVYDKWLSVLGGGEVVACDLAVALRNLGYHTTFITGQLIDSQIILQKLDINMYGINFIQAFNDEEKIKQVTKDADLFINASFYDYTQSKAKKQLYYASFPNIPQSKSTKAQLKIYLQKIISLLIVPIEKINSHQYIFYFLKPQTIHHLKFTLTLSQFSKSALSSLDYQIDNVKILNQKVSINHFKNQVNFDITVITNTNSLNLNIICPSDCSITVNSLFLNPLFSKLNSFFRSGYYPNINSRVHNFDSIIANSQYTQKWLKKYWSTPSTVLYPPVSLVKSTQKITKKNQICSIGRFFTLGHSKKQEIMIEAFKKLYDQGLKNWELHLAGGLGSEPTSLAYAEKLKKLSQSYPIFLHFNESHQFIENLYLESKIYWHAAGFDENPNKNPIKFEHFGITPIEAMNSGCVPVLFNGGGLSEVMKLLNLDIKLHLFNTVDELVTNTQKIIDQNIKLPSNINKQLGSLFGLERFKRQFKEIILKLK